MARLIDLRSLVSGGMYAQHDERLTVPNPVAPKVSKYEGMTVQYTPTRKKLSAWGQLDHPERVVKLVQELGLLDDTRERIYAFYTDIKYHPLGYRLISSGGRFSTPVDVPIVMGPAVALQAWGIFLVHNHPSGNTAFSDDDYKITGRLKEAGKILGITIMDHVSVGGNGDYTSMSQAGTL